MASSAEKSVGSSGDAVGDFSEFAASVWADFATFVARALSDAADAQAAFQVHLDQVSSRLAPFTAHLRPWAEFLVFKCPDMEQDILIRLSYNLAHFQTNYFVIGAMTFAISIYMHTAWLLAILILVCAWMVYIVRGGFDPDWKPFVAGVECSSWHRLAVLYAISSAVIFIVLGEAMLVELGAIGTCAMMHAVFHPAPNTCLPVTDAAPCSEA